MSEFFQDFQSKTHLVVWENDFTKRISWSSAWKISFVTDFASFQKVVASQGDEKSILGILPDTRFSEVADQVERDPKLNHAANLGLVALTAQGVEKLGKNWERPVMVGTFTEQEFFANPDFCLFRSLRNLIWRLPSSEHSWSAKTLESLNQILISISSERDPQRLLATIVEKAMELTSAQGGCLYMLDERDEEFYFRMKVTSRPPNEIHIQELNQKVAENSICGYVVLTGKIINIPKVEALRPMTLPQFLKGIDGDLSGQIPKSILTIALKNSRNETIGVLQLTNKRKTDAQGQAGIGEFNSQDESLLTSFNTQAAICLENSDLYRDIRSLFDGFIKASIAAIESRDPSTGGHSERVAKMCVSLARATSDSQVGIYRSVRFREEEIRELEYAALLHDFGKIGVREEILTKAKKLQPYQMDAIKDRLKICKAAAKILFLEQSLKPNFPKQKNEEEYRHRLREIDDYSNMIDIVNEPSVLRSENAKVLERIKNEKLQLPDGAQISLLTEEEYMALSVTQGSLTESERLEIESHVKHTYQFLKMIPWTREFRHLTDIAYCHHEKLDGSGYPRGLLSHEIPLQSKIMTIADIFDALTAADRWYKEAVPIERALDILHQEVVQGKIDPVLFDLFVEKKVYEVTLVPSQLRVVGQ